MERGSVGRADLTDKTDSAGDPHGPSIRGTTHHCHALAVGSSSAASVYCLLALARSDVLQECPSTVCATEISSCFIICEKRFISEINKDH